MQNDFKRNKLSLILAKNSRMYTCPRLPTLDTCMSLHCFDKRLREFPLEIRGRSGAGFRGEIARWLKTAVIHQSYLGGHAVKQAFKFDVAVCRRVSSICVVSYYRLQKW